MKLFCKWFKLIFFEFIGMDCFILKCNKLLEVGCWGLLCLLLIILNWIVNRLFFLELLIVNLLFNLFLGLILLLRLWIFIFLYFNFKEVVYFGLINGLGINGWVKLILFFVWRICGLLLLGRLILCWLLLLELKIIEIVCCLKVLIV